MKSSILIVAASAVLATAGPVHKRAMATKWVDEIVTVTVTAQPTPTAFVENKKPVAAPAQPTSAAPAPPKPSAAAPAKAAAAPPPPPQPQAPSPKPVEQPKPSAAPAPAPAPASNAGNDYQRAVLDTHNKIRADHSAGALTWSQDLADKAMNNAQKCVFAHDSSGQNLAEYGSTGALGSAADSVIKAINEQWYESEVASFANLYGAASPSGLMNWGHYTQVVWKGTQEVGCVTVPCNFGGMPSMYTVCDYAPAGK